MLGRKGLRGLAKVFEIILYKTLQRDMNMKSFIFLGFLFLGMRTIEVLFTREGKKPFSN